MINIPITEEKFQRTYLLVGHRHRCTDTLSVSAVRDIRTRWKAGVILLFSGLPSAVQTALGAGNYGLSLSGILGGYFWENIFTLVPFVFSIPVAASFVAGKLESGAFAWILSAL